VPKVAPVFCAVAPSANTPSSCIQLQLFSEEFVDDFLQKSCKPSTVLLVYRFALRMDTPIKVSYRLSAAEMLLLHRLHMRHSAQGRKVTSSFRNGGILFLILGIILLCGVALTPQKLRALGFGLGLVLLGAGILVGVPALLRTAALKAYAKKPDKDLVVAYELSEEGLSCKSDVASSNLLWRAIPKVQRLAEGFLLYVTDTQVHWLPNHGFQVPADADRFAGLAKAKVGDFKDER
jgi:YcxB-like protein